MTSCSVRHRRFCDRGAHVAGLRMQHVRTRFREMSIEDLAYSFGRATRVR
ncbi:hypothetical protein I541_5575 [Mycobacteroides abscessus]|nr:hypothetical protein I541_5575 [Mycobacteroides abscessus]